MCCVEVTPNEQQENIGVHPVSLSLQWCLFVWPRKWSCNGHKPTYRLVVGIAIAKGIGPTRLSQLEMSASQSSVWMQSHTLWWCVEFYSWFVPLFYFMLGVYTQFIPWNPTITQLQGIRITQPLIFWTLQLSSWALRPSVSLSLTDLQPVEEARWIMSLEECCSCSSWFLKCCNFSTLGRSDKDKTWRN